MIHPSHSLANIRRRYIFAVILICSFKPLIGQNTDNAVPDKKNSQKNEETAMTPNTNDQKPETTPKTTTSTDINKDEKNSPNSLENINPICHPALAAPQVGNYFYDKKGEAYYFVTQMHRLYKIAKDKSPLYRYYLYRLDLKTLKVKLLKVLTGKKMRFFISVGDPIKALYGYYFEEFNLLCANGKAQFTGFSLDPKVKFPLENVSKSNQPVFIGTPSGLMIFSPLEKSAYRLNENSPGKALGESIVLNKNETLVYFDKEKSHRYTVVSSGDKKTLVAYKNKKIMGQLDIGVNDRFIQQNDIFGSARYEKKDNLINIIEYPKWTAVDQLNSHYIYLDKELDARNNHLKVDFLKKIAIISGSDLEQRKRSKKLLIYDYKMGWLMSKIKLSKKNYIAFESISPNGDFVIAEIRDSRTDHFQDLKVYKISLRKWVEISMRSL